MQLEQKIRALVEQAGMESFVPRSESYGHAASTALARLTEIQPPPNRTLLDVERSLKILSGIRDQSVLPPVNVDEPPSTLTSCRYRLRDGFHRYQFSLILGFTHIPIVVLPYFELET